MAGSGGGGASTGTITYPSLVSDLFEELWGDNTGYPDQLTDDLSSIINDALTSGGGNPYVGEVAYNPGTPRTIYNNSPLDNMQDGLNTLSALITAMDEQTDWNAIITKAVTEIDSQGITWSGINTAIGTIVSDALTSTNSMLSSMLASIISLMTGNTDIDDAVDAYELALAQKRLNASVRVASGYADINSVNSSAFVFAMALIETEFDKDIEQYRRELRLKSFDTGVRVYVEAYVTKIREHIKSRNIYDSLRQTMISGGIAEMATLLKSKYQSYQAMTAIQTEINRITLTAFKEQDDRQLDLDMREARWDYELVLQAGNLLSNLAGGSAGYLPGQPSAFNTTLGGALQGAASGAAIGSAFGPAGSIIGGVGGLLAGLF